MEPYASSGDKFKCVEILVKYSPTHFLYNVQSYDNLTGSASMSTLENVIFVVMPGFFVKALQKYQQ